MVKNDPNLIHVPEELFETAESRHFEGETVLDELVAGPDAYRFAAPVAWSVAVTNTGDALLVMGTARAPRRPLPMIWRATSSPTCPTTTSSTWCRSL